MAHICNNLVTDNINSKVYLHICLPRLGTLSTGIEVSYFRRRSLHGHCHSKLISRKLLILFLERNEGIIFILCWSALWNCTIFFRVTNFSEQKLNVKAIIFTENSARTFQATRRHNPTDHKINLHHSLNLKSRKTFFVLSSVILNFVPEQVKFWRNKTVSWYLPPVL